VQDPNSNSASPPDPGPARAPRRGITARSLLIGFALMPLNMYWMVQIEEVRWAGYPTTVSLFYNVVFWMLILLGLNWPVRRLVPRWALSHSELLTIYVLLSLSSAAGSLDMVQVLIPVIAFPYYYATPENGWADLFHQHIPNWLVVDKGTAQAMWEGGHKAYDPSLWHPWLEPLAWWTGFLVALFAVFLGINLVFRHRWVASERLSFPIVQLPLEMTDPETPIFRSRAMWLAFGAAAFVELMNGLHSLKPAIPAIPTVVLAVPQFNLGRQLVDSPWNAIGFAPVSFYPFVIGMGLLLPTELSFSCWFFFWFYKAERVFSTWRGVTLPGAPFILEQSFGGYVGLALFAMWIGRRYLGRTLVAAIQGQAAPSDETGGWGYRLAYGLIAAGGVFLVAFSQRAGMSAGYAVAFFVLYFLVSLAVTRIRAEMGLPVHDLHFAGPHQTLDRILGSRLLGPGNETVGSIYYWFNRAYRSHPMPHAAEAFKLYEAVGRRATGLWPAMVASILVGSVLSCVTQLHFYYDLGAAAGLRGGQVPLWIGGETWRELAARMMSPTPPNWHSGAATALGAAFTFCGMLLSTRVLWWPIHPAGYAVSASWAMERLWCPLFIAWLVKSLVIRYGGNRAFLRAVPYAFGLILGDFAMGSFWNIYGIIKDVKVYSFWD